MHRKVSCLSLAALLFGFAVAGRAAPSCDPIETFADGKTPLREIFVASSGSNSSGDGSQAKPYQTVARAAQGIRPGDAIRLLPGDYPGGIGLANASGTEAAPIWLGGVPGEARPAIRGGSGGMLLNRVRFLVVENLEVSGATGNGINCDDGGEYANSNATRAVVFRNLFIHDIGTGGNNDGLKLSGVNDYFVLDCEFARISAGGSAIDHVGCHNGIIGRSSFTDSGNGVQCKGGSENIEIRWNRFVNAGSRAINIGGSTGFTFFRPPLATNAPNFEARNIRVFANVFEGSDAPVAFVGAVESLAANNTMIDPTRWIVRILQETTSNAGFQFLPCGNNEFSNNLIWYRRNGISTHVNVGANTDAASFKFANNLWHAHDQPSRSQPSLPVAEANGTIGQNPQFANLAAKDYSVGPGSPAAGKGKAIPRLKADYRERCYAAPPSIGAFEANPPEPPRADSDLDGMPDEWEWVAGTDPNDSGSVLKIGAALTAQRELSLSWPAAAGRIYRVETRPLADQAAWQSAATLAGRGLPLVYGHRIEPEGMLFRVAVALENSPEL